MTKFSQILLVLLLSLPALAAPIPVVGPSDGRAPSSAKVTPAGYRLQPGDELELHIFALPAGDNKLQIRADGGFYHRILGEVQAAGRTLDDLRFEIGRRLKRELKNPSFELGLVSYAKGEVSVLGEVKNQGKFSFYYGATILDVLAQAGGLNESADPDGVTVLRNGKMSEVELKPLGPNSPAPMPMQPEDIVYVHRGNRISVAGEVQKPGIVAVSRRAGSAVADAMKLAGGSKPNAALNRIKIIRPSLPSAIIVNLLSGPPSDRETPLLDGDSVFVPERHALLMGSGKPGPVALASERVPLLDVLAAGGVDGTARLDEVSVVRAAELRSPQPKREIYNVEDFLANGEGQPGPYVEDGDLVYVPQKDTRQGVFDNPLTLLNLIFLARSFFF